MHSEKPPPSNENSEFQDDAALPKLEFNPDKYRANIANYYPSEEQQNEVLRILWNIGDMLIDMNLGVDSVQVLLPDLFENAGADSDNLLERIDSMVFNAAANNNDKGET